MNSFSSASLRKDLDSSLQCIDIEAGAQALGSSASQLPKTLLILLENLLRRFLLTEDESLLKEAHALLTYGKDAPKREPEIITFRPNRILMQDFTGIPAIVDLSAMRNALKELGLDPEKINPSISVDLVVDHSVTVDYFGSPQAFRDNTSLELFRNRERYEFLKWSQNAFQNFRVIPPGTGICHQVNLEYLASVYKCEETPEGNLCFPDTLIGTDSHTTMINGIGVLGWGVGGIEAEACMLGQSLSMEVPQVLGVELVGKLAPGVTGCDLVLTLTERLRKHGVVGKFVEFFGEGLDFLPLEDRASVSNMAPEYGATCAFFPIDEETCRYLLLTGRAEDHVRMIQHVSKVQGIWGAAASPSIFSETIQVDLSTIETCLAGPKRPQERVVLRDVSEAFSHFWVSEKPNDVLSSLDMRPGRQVEEGDVVIAAITSCTNTSNPTVMMAAGLLARKALLRGLSIKPWVKTSLAPGSGVVMDYLETTGLYEDLSALGFSLVGFGCTTCIGNSGPLPAVVAEAIEARKLIVGAVLSGNRNFEGRIHPQVRASFLASPPLVVAYALAGSLRCNITQEPLGLGTNGEPVFLKDIWPTPEEIQELISSALSPALFFNRYKHVEEGGDGWRNLESGKGVLYPWNEKSTYIACPPFLTSPTRQTLDFHNARPLLMLGDSVTTDHISPAGTIRPTSPAGKFLAENNVDFSDFNSYGSRRGNHKVMIRGTFAHPHLQNKMVPHHRGGVTRCFIEGEEKIMSVFEAAETYRTQGVPLVVIAGKEYGTGSSRDWAAKGPKLLGVRAVIAENFERIHRSNLIGMGILPLEFPEGTNADTLGLDGSETFSCSFPLSLTPKLLVDLIITLRGGSFHTLKVKARIDTPQEVQYLKHGGILPFVLDSFIAA